MTSFKYSLLAATIASILGVPAFAADSSALEEVVVTAQKRAQNQQEVPISMNTLSGSKLEEAGITSIQGISDYVPSFNMTQTGIGTNIAIRGISSGVNQGFEQSAAEFVDGIHYGRSQLARAPFLDIQRIEILRGPQSILFGKNSTAGAVSITTAKPTDKFEGSLTTLYEPEYGERDARLVLSGPISETLAGRVALMSRSYDGFIENTTLNQDEAQEKDRVIRVSFAWKPVDDLTFNLKMEDGKFDSIGRNIETIHEVTDPTYNTQLFNGQPDSNPYKTVLSFLTGGKYLLDTTLDGKRQSNGDYSNNDTQNVTLTTDYDFNDLKLTSVTGYNAYTYSELCDCDFTGASGFNIFSDENYHQFSQEIRLASSEKQTLSWIAGVFYQGSKIKFHDNIFVPTDSVIATAVSPLLRGASTQRDFNQDTSLSAVFGQLTWNFLDSTRLVVGGRYTQETKDASRNQYHVAPNGQPTNSPVYKALWAGFGVIPRDINGSFDESGFNPQIVLQHDLNANNHLYASYTTGFKSGGFDVRSNAPNKANADPAPFYKDILGSWDFKKENAKNYEMGGKFLFLDGTLEFNTAIFREEFTDMQTSQFDGNLSFNVTNAGAAVVQGIEMDTRYAIIDNLLMRGGISYIDFNYTKFPNGQCAFGQPATSGTSCDQTDMRREFVPKIQGNVGWDYKYFLSSGLKITSTLDVIYSDSYFTTPSLDARMMQDAYTKINARIALAGNDNKWEIALIGKNLTDQHVITYANGLPVASTLTKKAGSGYYAFFGEPRSVALQATLHF